MEKIYEDFNEPDEIKVDAQYYFELKEDLYSYKLTIGVIEEELQSEEADADKLIHIQHYIERLKEELHKK